ncbi:FtsX-like permease family protein [Clostridium paridis]|uniref:FtsX-like permease family protein n=1 Tax=Clostridium paridis TaxID=2803863 RepID=A0A937K450_9CLOT|nr:FtsX-like permease family protein [Clostridium paridis]MBL4931499.1 FtsX-like permease family protein [Clostridium paridis]
MNYTVVVWENFRRNIRKFAAFITACTISITLNFVYSTLVNNKEILLIAKNNLVVATLRLSFIIIILILSFFLVYSYNSYIRSRDKEFKLLMFIGLTKKELFKLVLLENLLLIILCSLLGAILGGVFSKISFVALIKYLGVSSLTYNLEKINFMSILLFSTIIYLIVLTRTRILLRKVNIYEESNTSGYRERIRKYINRGFLIVILITDIVMWIDSFKDKSLIYLSNWLNCVLLIYVIVFYFSKLCLYFFKKKKVFYNGRFLLFKETIRNLEKGKVFIFYITFFSFLFITYNSIYNNIIFNQVQITGSEIKILELIAFFTKVLFFIILSNILYYKSQIDLEYIKEYFQKLYLIGLTKDELRVTASRLLKSIFFMSCTLNMIITIIYSLWIKMDIRLIQSNNILIVLSYMFNCIAYINAKKKYKEIIDIL